MKEIIVIPKKARKAKAKAEIRKTEMLVPSYSKYDALSSNVLELCLHFSVQNFYILDTSYNFLGKAII